MPKRVVFCKDINEQMNLTDFYRSVSYGHCLERTRRHPGVKRFATQVIVSGAGFFAYRAIKADLTVNDMLGGCGMGN